MSASGIPVRDVHAGIFRAEVLRVERPRTVEELQEVWWRAMREGRAVSVCGKRHAMGGQAWGAGTVLVDLSGLKGFDRLDRDNGVAGLRSGMTWPEVLDRLHAEQRGEGEGIWSIRQKQTGADGLSLGGAVAANVHGRGLRMGPFVADVRALEWMDSDGEVRTASRDDGYDDFRHLVGGYGGFGIVTGVELRLKRRGVLERRVEMAMVDEVVEKLDAGVGRGAEYGDFQFAIDAASEDFLRLGVLSYYLPTGAKDPGQAMKELMPGDWDLLLEWAHVAPKRAFEAYAKHYLETDGGRYWSDVQQLGWYPEGYHGALDKRMGWKCGSEMITELYVPRDRLAAMMKEAAWWLRRRGLPVIYGTVRMIEKDEETALPWAKQRWACVIFNLHVEHGSETEAAAAVTFQGLIDVALGHGGNFYLTYHRWVRRDQLLAGYPELPEVLAERDRRDPEGHLRSDWWDYVRRTVGGG